MVIIKTLTDENFGLNTKQMINPRKREAARGLVFNNEGKIAILHKSKKNEYKLIGGGMDDGENSENTFKREVLEETGCVVEIDKLLGKIIEIKSQDNFIQISYVYLSHVIEDTGNKHLTAQEIGEESICMWLDIDEAMNLIKDSENKLVASQYDGELSVYHTKFIVRRDYEILKYYKNYQEFLSMNKS